MQIKKSKYSILVAAMMVLAVGTGGASAVTLTYQNPTNIFNGNKFKDLTIQKAGLPGPATTRPRAGGFSLTDGVNDFVAWCLDITHFVASNTSYFVTDTPFSNTGDLTLQGRLGNIKELFGLNYKPSILADADKSAGFQLALWELLYETGDLDASNGSFMATAGGGAITAANTFLSTLGSGLTGQSYKFTFYESSNGTRQNLVSVAPIPLPAAGFLLGTGLLGLFALQRRRHSLTRPRNPRGQRCTMSVDSQKVAIVRIVSAPAT